MPASHPHQIHPQVPTRTSSLQIKEFFDPATFTLTYVVFDSASKDAVVIDPVMDYDSASSKVSFKSAEKVLQYLEEKQLKLHYILETHAHADHLSGAQVIQKKHPQSRIAVNARIQEVQKTFKGIFQLPDSFKTDGSQFDKLLADEEMIEAGNLKIKTIYTPGHTPACTSFLIEDALFTGDTLFIPDLGTGRCDFPSGSAKDLYHSIVNRIYTLPDTTRIFVGHDYPTHRKELRFQTTVADQKNNNAHLRFDTELHEFINTRTGRDKTLNTPRLLYPSIQVNIQAGRLPSEEDNGGRYLKIPLLLNFNY